ncbi:hypothetical protein KJ359_007468 [Pestalotiopsis sp. 9143b]|nr:hypothetical protein KJ359_007468 [Pestalotiopsis sp. 9143b]
MSSNSRLWGADLFLLEKWDAASALSDDEQLTHWFSLYIQVPFSQRYSYRQRGLDRGLNTAADLPQADQELLSRLRTPEERQIVDMIWVRTVYDAGTDSAFEAFMRAIPCETELPIFQDSARYNFGGGDGWRRIFSRLPQILEPHNSSSDDYDARKQKALEECIEAERQDTQEVEDQGGDPEEDGTYWPELYSAYHYRAKVGMVLVVDMETLLVAAEDPKRATVLAVWFDEMSHVIRQTRLTAQETWNVEGLEMTMGGALPEHGEWTRADIGEDYDWEGPFGPPFTTE